MAGVNTAGTAGTLTQLPTVLSRFLLLEQERGKVLNTATREQLLPHNGTTFNMLNYNQFTAASVAEGVDAAQAQTLSDAKTTASPGEVVVNVIVSDRTVSRVADPNLIGQVGEMCMNAIELKEDQDGCAKFASFTPILGSTGVVCSVGHLLAGEAILRIGNSQSNPEPAPGPWWAVLHPSTLAAAAVKLIPLSQVVGSNVSDLTKAEATAGKLGATVGLGVTNDLGMEVLRGKGLLWQLEMGALMVLADANVALSSNDATCSIYAQKGLVYVSETTPSQVQERDESLRGVEITCVESYAWMNYRPGAYGIKCTFDASTPTA